MSSIPVVVYPTPVQGEDAARKIAQAIETANERAECDVLIVCRGGGSIEDLWAFNEEIVARAIAASAIPVISGVGHETDFTIADFAADQRAATPTAAAQLAVPNREELSSRLRHAAQRLQRAARRNSEQAMQRLDFLQRRLTHPRQKIRQQADALAQLQQRLSRARPDLARLTLRQSEWRDRLRGAMRRALEQREARLVSMKQHLAHLDPKQVLARGYSLVRDERGGIVSDGAALPLGARLDILFAAGWARAEVRERGGKQ
jgi:exodeoxyribonuclease VII large subunit